MDSEENKDARIFVGNVSPDTEPELIEQRFKNHGNVKDVAVHKGYCFVQFETAAEAKGAIEKENGTMLLGKRIDVKTATRKKVDPAPAAPPPVPPQEEKRIDHYQEVAPPDYDYNKRGGRGGRGGHSDRGGADRGGRRGRGGDRGRGRGRGGGDGGYDRGHDRGHDRGRDYDRDQDRGYNDRGGRGTRGRGRGGYDYGRGGYQDEYYQEEYYEQPTAPPAIEPQNVGANRKVNDCEIVCVSRNQRQYAERIEARLRVIGLKVDVLFPNPKVDLNKIMGNIATRGVMFAILITPLNEDHGSVTLNVLQGQQQEHRNMPLDDAVNLIAQMFESGLDKPKPTQAANAAPQNRGGIPEDVRTVFGFLLDARPLSVMEYDKLIKYLVKKREDMLKNEYGDNIPANLITPPIGPPLDSATKAKQDELQSRIMDILNKKKEPEPKVAPELSASLQKAIDSLIKSGPNLLNAGSASATAPNVGGSVAGYGGSSSNYYSNYQGGGGY